MCKSVLLDKLFGVGMKKDFVNMELVLDGTVDLIECRWKRAKEDDETVERASITGSLGDAEKGEIY